MRSWPKDKEFYCVYYELNLEYLWMLTICLFQEGIVTHCGHLQANDYNTFWTMWITIRKLVRSWPRFFNLPSSGLDHTPLVFQLLTHTVPIHIPTLRLSMTGIAPYALFLTTFRVLFVASPCDLSVIFAAYLTRQAIPMPISTISKGHRSSMKRWVKIFFVTVVGGVITIRYCNRTRADEHDGHYENIM